jgi:predicted ATPase
LVPHAVAVAVRVVERPGYALIDTLRDALYGSKILILVDNCEHVIEATATLIDTLLRACPELRIVATSREPPATAGEVVYRVPPLTLPSSGTSPRAPQAFESVQRWTSALFSSAVTFSFAVTPLGRGIGKRAPRPSRGNAVYAVDAAKLQRCYGLPVDNS